MTAVDAVLRSLHEDESELAGLLVEVSDRHKNEHEVHFVARDLAGWSRQHARRLVELGEARGVGLPSGSGLDLDLLGLVKRWGAELLERPPEPPLRLLADLRAVHVKAAGVSIDWELVAQAAQATEDAELLELVSACHPETLRQLRWANAHLKVLAAQALTG